MNNGICIKILVDNSSIKKCTSEHGLALWIETDDKKVVFDTGQNSNTLLSNAKALGVDLSEADTLILSHGHYDHTGGVSEILKLSPETDVYYHPALISSHYAVRSDSVRSIGIPDSSLDCLEKHPKQRIHHILKPSKISQRICISGEIPRINDFEDTGGPFYLNPEGTIPDQLPDDLSIWIETPKGLVVCTGCCHSGLINTLNHITKTSKVDNIVALIGGLHLMNGSETRIQSTVEQLKQFSISQIIPCHCTGERAVELLSDHFHSTQGYAGMEILLNNAGEISSKKL